MNREDIVRDIIDRVASALEEHGVETCFMAQIERQVRNDWGGDRPYIARAGEAGREVVSRRNAAILTDWQAGERAAAIARKFGVSRGRIWQIVKKR